MTFTCAEAETDAAYAYEEVFSLRILAAMCGCKVQ